MAGGLGRAQSGYDEMVFRSMVQGRHAVLRSARAGVRRHEDRLPGADQLVSVRHAVHDVAGAHLLARAGRRVGGAAATAAAPTTPRSSGSVRHVARGGLGRVDGATRRAFQQTNLEAIRTYPMTPHRTSPPRALGSVSRAYLDAATRHALRRASTTRASSRTSAPSRRETGRRSSAGRRQGPDIYTVTSLARDPDSGTLFYTTDNSACRDLVALDPATRQAHAAAEGRAHRRPGVRSRRQVALGHPAAQRPLHARAHRRRRTRMEAGRTRSRTAPWSTTSTSRPTAASWSASFGEISGKQDVRVLRVEALRPGRRDAGRAVRLRHAVPNSFVFSPDGRYLYGSSYYTGVSNIFRYEIATDEARGGHQRRHRLLPADSARRRRADRVPLHG